MIDRIVDLSVNHRYKLLLVLAVLCIVGWWSMKTIPMDAMPELGETQVILYTKWDRSPDTIEDQVTYPIVTALTGAPHVKTVRGLSDFGYSLVYVIFEGGTDLYWARARTMEHLTLDASSEVDCDWNSDCAAGCDHSNRISAGYGVHAAVG